MGFLSRRRSSAPTAESPWATPIGSIEPRQPVVVVGEVSRMRSHATSGEPSLMVTLTDPSGALTVVWTGRRSIGGIVLGRRLAVRGVARAIGSGLEMTNPAYTLLP